MRPESTSHLWEAAQAAELVRAFTAGSTEDEFTEDLLRRSAVERQLEILGEALNRLRKNDAGTAARIPDLGKIIGMRNVIAHEYGAVDYGIVWAAVTKRLPDLAATLDTLIAEAGPAPDIRESR